MMIQTSLLQELSLQEMSFRIGWRDSKETEELIIISRKEYLHDFGDIRVFKQL